MAIPPGAEVLKLTTKANDLKLEDLLDHMSGEGGLFKRTPRNAKDLHAAIDDHLFEFADGEYSTFGKLNDAKLKIDHIDTLKTSGLKFNEGELKKQATNAYSEIDKVLKKVNEAEIAMSGQRLPLFKEVDKTFKTTLDKLQALQKQVSAKGAKVEANASTHAELFELLNSATPNAIKEKDVITIDHVRDAVSNLKTWHTERHEALGTLVKDAQEIYAGKKEYLKNLASEIEKKSGHKYLPSALKTELSTTGTKAGEVANATSKAEEEVNTLSKAFKGNKWAAGVGTIAALYAGYKGAQAAGLVSKGNNPDGTPAQSDGSDVLGLMAGAAVAVGAFIYSHGQYKGNAAALMR